MEGVNCPLNLEKNQPDYVAGVCDGIVVPCSTMCFHILGFLLFNIYFRPHVVIKVS